MKKNNFLSKKIFVGKFFLSKKHFFVKKTFFCQKKHFGKKNIFLSKKTFFCRNFFSVEIFLSVKFFWLKFFCLKFFFTETDLNSVQRRAHLTPQCEMSPSRTGVRDEPVSHWGARSASAEISLSRTAGLRSTLRWDFSPCLLATDLKH